MPRVVHFEIHADDPERAASFYRSVLGWEITKWDGPFDYWLVRTGPREEMGIDGGILRRQGSGPCDCIQAYVCTIGVKSIDQALKAIADNRGQIVQPKQEIPGVGWLAYCKDTEGNIFGVLQPVPMPM